MLVKIDKSEWASRSADGLRGQPPCLEGAADTADLWRRSYIADEFILGLSIRLTYDLGRLTQDIQRCSLQDLSSYRGEGGQTGSVSRGYWDLAPLRED